MSDKRKVSIGMPSGFPKIELFGGTDDAVRVRIFKEFTSKPFARYRGQVYFLTPEEIQDLRILQNTAKKQ